MQFRGNRTWWLVLGVAFALRLAMISLQSSQLEIDRDAYLEIARNVVAGEGFSLGNPPRPTAYRPPLYPLTIAGLFACGGTPWALGWLQAILGTATVLLAGRVACRFGGKRAGLAAGGLVAVDPLLLQYTAQPMTETLAGFLAAAWLAQVAPQKNENPLLRWQLASGVLLGLASLCRPTFLVVAGLYGVMLFGRVWRAADVKCAAVRLGILAFGVAGTLLPWGLRNACVMGQPIITTTHGGYTLLLANNPVMYEEVIRGKWGGVWGDESLRNWQAGLERETSGMSEIQRDRWMSAQAWMFIGSEPGACLYACVWRVLRLWDVAPRGPQLAGSLRFAVPLIAAFYLGVYAAFLVGCVRNLGNGPQLWLPVVSLLLGFTLLHTLYWTDARMRAPLMPAIAVVAALGLTATFGRRSAT